MSNDREWYIAMSRLEAFEKETPAYISQAHVDQFHEILQLFARGTGQDISVFRIPDEQMQLRVVSFTMATRRRPGTRQYSSEKYCDDNFFRRRLIEVRSYFSNFQPPHKR